MRRAWPALVVVAACGGEPAPPVLVEVVMPGLDAARLRVTPEVDVSPTLRGAWLRAPAGVALELRHPEACPATLRAGEREIALTPLVSLVAPRAPVGFAAEATVELRAGCPEGQGGEVTWRGEGSVDGRSLSVRTPTLAEARPGPLPWGIVPFSPATRGELTVEATWRGPTGATLVRSATIAAVARATGVPSVPAGATFVLGGDGWRAVSGPRGFEGSVGMAGGLTTFTPGRTGRFALQDGAGRKLDLRVGRHDETPLDCGRAECHPRATQASVESPMTRVLFRGLEGQLGADHDARCALACHAVGEPGLPDGGFVELAEHLGVTLPARPARGAWDALPRALRRLGGVGCTSCHGPGAIPEESARWSILRADVCATCHDAPPRYAIVAAWRASSKARSDAAPGTGAAGCRECHTTAGFLDAQGLRKLDMPPPPEIGPMGIACAACHAPHGEHGPTALLRAPPAPAALGGDLPPAAAASAVCLPCHAPRDPRTPAASSAAAMWLGRGGVRADGQALIGTAVHAAIGCGGCHDTRGHALARTRCAGCHDTPPAVDVTIAARAAALWQRVGGAPHEHGGDGPAAAAARDVALVVRDRAAAVHNPAYARALLDEAERMLAAP